MAGSRKVILAGAYVVVGATSVAFGQGGNISIVTSPDNVSGLTPGLVATVWHVGAAQLPSAPVPAMTDINNVESYIATGSASYGGYTYNLPTAAYSFLNTADTFDYPANGANGGYAATYYYLGKDAAGAATVDGNPWGQSIIDQLGYIKIAQAGTYTFRISQADDAANVMVGGTYGVADTGTEICAAGFNTTNIPAAENTAQVAFSSAGYYPIEIMNYQQVGAAGMQFAVNSPAGAAPVSYFSTPAAAAGVTPFSSPPVIPSASPPPLHEWNFSTPDVNGNTITDVGSGGSSATAGILTGGATISNAALLTTNISQQGMIIPYAALSGISGSFSLEDVFIRSAADTGYSTLFSFGQSTSEFLLSHPSRLDNQTLTGELYNGTLQSGGTGPIELNWKNGAAVAGQTTVEVMAFDASDDMLSYYVNGVLQGSAFVTGGLNLSQLAGTTGTDNGIGGFDAFGDPAFAGATMDFRIYGSALTAGQVLSDYQAFVPNSVPAPATLLLFGLGAIGLLLMRRSNPGRGRFSPVGRSVRSRKLTRQQATKNWG
jgi:hypothetical protein